MQSSGGPLKLPHDPEAERAVLGAVISDPAALLRVVDKLRGEEFYLGSHQSIFAACVALHESSRAADLLTLTDALREQERLTQVGGASYLASLVDAVPDVANVEHYASIVHDKAVKRRLIRAAQQTLEVCSQDQGGAQAAVEAAQREVLRIAEDTLEGGLIPLRELVPGQIEAIERSRANRSGLTGLDTGVVQLNSMTSGFQDSDLIILAARPSMGKTSLGLNIAAHAALRGSKKVAVFSLEMSSDQLVRRLLASEARVDQKRLSSGYLHSSEWSPLTEAAQRVSSAPVWIDDTPGATVLELSAKARRLQQEHGLDFVVVDYLQLMSGGGSFNSRNEEVSSISRGLKGMAKELNIPVLVLSQLSRQPDRRGGDHRPQLSDLRESGSIEQDADIVLFILRPSVYDPNVEDKRMSFLIVAKQRNGPTGEIPLVFQHEYTRFENVDQTHAEPF